MSGGPVVSPSGFGCTRCGHSRHSHRASYGACHEAGCTCWQLDRTQPTNTETTPALRETSRGS